MSHQSELINTTQMYLRTIFELCEEGIVPLRTRIAERLGQSGPTVSQTVARMERDGLLQLADDRRLELTTVGLIEATAVMRKHRLAERLLFDVIGLEWADVHIEACRWEHVMSETVEKRIVELLDRPLNCPHGYQIPGLELLGVSPEPESAPVELITLTAAAQKSQEQVRVARVSESIQSNSVAMRQLAEGGVRPEQILHVARTRTGVAVQGAADRFELSFEFADAVFVYA